MLPLADGRGACTARKRPQLLLPSPAPGMQAMNLHALTTAPSNELAEALAHFEAQFSYPLGPGRSFRISHGNDYAHFFRALGEAVCFVAESEGVVIGTLGAAI